VALVRISLTNKKKRKETFCFKDPYNRRLIWTIIRKLKSTGKCVLLTTHFLEEADVLSDRIAIMSRGRLQANGTPDFLKQQTGWKKINLTKIQIFDI
jgi:ABC-type multidrug transport system ATPase subunit